MFIEIFKSVDKLVSPLEYNSYFYLPAKFNKKMETSALLAVTGFFDFPHRNYRNGWNNSIYFREAIKNARVHGGNLEGKDTFCGVFRNMDKFCFGINDGGDYFKREEIKDIWENRKKLNEFHETADDQTGFHIGYSVIKDWEGDLIVDTTQGTLYLAKEFRKN